MRRPAAAVLAAVSFAAVPAAVAAPGGGAVAFGRSGGNIIPFTVTIEANGDVQVTGPVHAGRTSLTQARLRSLRRLAARVRFATLPAQTRCSGTLPDIATTFVRIGGRTVHVHGGCVPRYAKLWTAVSAAVELSY